MGVIWQCQRGSHCNLYAALYSVTSYKNTPPSLGVAGGKEIRRAAERDADGRWGAAGLRCDNRG